MPRKSAVFRHLQTLLERGYLTQDGDTNRFRLGLKAFPIGHPAPPAWDVGRILERPMRDLRDAIGLAIVLSTPSPVGALVGRHLSRYPPDSRSACARAVKLALHAAAERRSSWPWGPPSLTEQVLATPRQAFTERTITGEAALLGRTGARSGYRATPWRRRRRCSASTPWLRPSGTIVTLLVGAVALVGSIQHLAIAAGARSRSMPSAGLPRCSSFKLGWDMA